MGRCHSGPGCEIVIVFADPTDDSAAKVIKVFRIISWREVRFNKLGPHIVDAGMARELFQKLAEAIPHGACLFDWKIEHHTVDELDESGRRWPGAVEDDVVVQGYIRYQLPKGE